MKYASHACPVCGSQTTRRKHCFSCAGVHVRSDTLVHPTSRYEDDPAAQLITSMGGVTLEFVAEALGVTRERIRQIQARALEKLVPRLKLVGVGREDIASILATRTAEVAPAMDRSDTASMRKGRLCRGSSPTALMRNLDKPHGTRLDREMLRAEFYSEHGERLNAAADEMEAQAVRALLASGLDVSEAA